MSWSDFGVYTSTDKKNALHTLFNVGLTIFFIVVIVRTLKRKKK